MAEKICSVYGKISHASKAAANHALKLTEEKNASNRECNTFYCSHCSGWHWGHDKPVRIANPKVTHDADYEWMELKRTYRPGTRIK